MSPSGTIEALIGRSQAATVAEARVPFGSFGSGAPTFVSTSMPVEVVPAARTSGVTSVARSNPDSPDPLKNSQGKFVVNEAKWVFATLNGLLVLTSGSIRTA